jgi:hypothetical protein
MTIGMVSAHVPATTATSFPHAWPLTTSLNPPATPVNKGTCNWSSPNLKCKFASKLTKGVSYGLAMPGASAVAGAFAPITIETRMNNLAATTTSANMGNAMTGPVRDCNRVFDSVNVDVAAPAMVLAATKIIPTAGEKKYPGETTEVEWTITMANWAATKVVKAPYNIVMKLGAGGSRAQVATSNTWEKYPITYDDWTWVTTCTNTQFGVDDTNTDDKIPAVTMTNKTPKCSVVNGALVIEIAQDLTSTDYSTFKMKFKISVKLPSNKIVAGTTVDAWLADPNSNNVHAAAAQLTDQLAVSRPAGEAASQATGLVSFGKNPNDATEVARGVGVYSTIYCQKEGDDLGATYKSNCGITTAFDALAAAGVKTKELPLVNALEVNWALPYEIPGDRTQADIVCKTEFTAGGNDNAAKYANDPLKILQSSMIAKGFGTANCFYLGAKLDAQGSHRFQCLNTGKLAKSANLQLAFQFHITNSGKTLPMGDSTSDATKGRVNLIALTLSCELKVSTWASATTSTVLWYQSKFTTQVDGNTQASKSGHW